MTKDEKYTTIKIWMETKRLAKRLANDTGETLVAFLHRLVLEEQKIKKGNE